MLNLTYKVLLLMMNTTRSTKQSAISGSRKYYKNHSRSFNMSFLKFYNNYKIVPSPFEMSSLVTVVKPKVGFVKAKQVLVKIVKGLCIAAVTVIGINSVQELGANYTNLLGDNNNTAEIRNQANILNTDMSNWMKNPYGSLRTFKSNGEEPIKYYISEDAMIFEEAIDMAFKDWQFYFKFANAEYKFEKVNKQEYISSKIAGKGVISFDVEFFKDSDPSIAGAKSSGYITNSINTCSKIKADPSKLEEYNTEEQASIFFHELGHCWGFADVYELGLTEKHSFIKLYSKEHYLRLLSPEDMKKLIASYATKSAWNLETDIELKQKIIKNFHVYERYYYNQIINSKEKCEPIKNRKNIGIDLAKTTFFSFDSNYLYKQKDGTPAVLKNCKFEVLFSGNQFECNVYYTNPKTSVVHIVDSKKGYAYKGDNFVAFMGFVPLSIDRNDEQIEFFFKDEDGYKMLNYDVGLLRDVDKVENAVVLFDKEAQTDILLR